MCGIAGIYARPGAEAPQDLLLAMAGELRHRGPDGTGLYRDGRFGMTNNRLAIVDLEGGDQPLSDEDGRYWVMQNGEIYNYVELQAELEGLGHRFTTTSDTEVIAHAYAEWGPACLERLNGDFAFAVWDRRERELFLARDRFGVRPLFVAELGGDLVFGSELRAILRHPPRAGSGRARRELHDLVHLAGRVLVPRHPGAGPCALPPRRGRRPRGGAALVGPPFLRRG
jgi:asparagine synthase (glutamine-hydrolysing)